MVEIGLSTFGMFTMVSSSGTLVKSEDTSYDYKMSRSLIIIPWSSSANCNMGFSFSSNDFATDNFTFP